MQILYPFAKRFIAGEDLKTAMRAIKRIHRAGFLCSLDILGENVTNPAQVETAKNEYLELVREFADSPVPMDFSVKLTQLGLDIDAALCRKNLEEIAAAAGSHTVRLDMEGSPHTERTLEMCHQVHPQFPNLGQAVQAYLFRTQADLEKLIENNISVRLCKGAYKEPESIAHTSMDAIRENFLKQAHLLLKEGNQPAIATHDEYLLEKILAFIEKENIDPQSFYFEMLYGVGRDLQKILLKRGYKVRVYTPFGSSWLPYTLRRLAEKKENILFVVKNLFKETFGLRKLK